MIRLFTLWICFLPVSAYCEQVRVAPDVELYHEQVRKLVNLYRKHIGGHGTEAFRQHLDSYRNLVFALPKKGNAEEPGVEQHLADLAQQIAELLANSVPVSSEKFQRQRHSALLLLAEAYLTAASALPTLDNLTYSNAYFYKFMLTLNAVGTILLIRYGESIEALIPMFLAARSLYLLEQSGANQIIWSPKWVRRIAARKGAPPLMEYFWKQLNEKLSLVPNPSHDTSQIERKMWQRLVARSCETVF